MTLCLWSKGIDQEAGEEPSKTDDGKDHPEVVRGSPLTDILNSFPFFWKIEPNNILHEECAPQLQPFKEEESAETGDDPDDDGYEYDPLIGSDALLDLHGCKKCQCIKLFNQFYLIPLFM